MEESCFSAQFLSRQLTWVPAIYSPICQTKFTVKIHRSTCRSMHWKSVYTPYSFLSPTFCNTGAYLGIIRDIASSNWIGGVGMGIYIFLELIPVAIILIMFFWLRKEKERILSQDSTPFYIDDDYYWRKRLVQQSK